MKLREEKGYTYGASAGFDLRRGAGPFAARAAVNTEVTVPAVLDMLGELDAIRGSEAKASELTAARDFLIGVFPLRFETAGAVVGALWGLSVHELDLDELIALPRTDRGGRREGGHVGATSHLHLEDAAIVLVGDADAFGEALEAEQLGPMVIERDAPEPALPTDQEESPGPVDRRRSGGPHRGRGGAATARCPGQPVRGSRLGSPRDLVVGPRRVPRRSRPGRAARRRRPARRDRGTHGASVQLVGKVGEDDAGEAVVLALTARRRARRHASRGLGQPPPPDRG